MLIPGEHEDITRHIEPMGISVKGKNLDVGDALNSHVGAQLNGTVTKYYNHAIDATAIFSCEGQDMCADISVDPIPPDFVVQSSGETEEHCAALDGAQDQVANSSSPISASWSTITQRTGPSTTCCPSGNVGWDDPANTLPSQKTIA